VIETACVIERKGEQNYWTICEMLAGYQVASAVGYLVDVSSRGDVVRCDAVAKVAEHMSTLHTVVAWRVPVHGLEEGWVVHIAAGK
jgi:hypothetical protein